MINICLSASFKKYVSCSAEVTPVWTSCFHFIFLLYLDCFVFLLGCPNVSFVINTVKESIEQMNVSKRFLTIYLNRK